MTSTVLCQGEKGWDSLHFVFVGEDGEEDAVHRGSILKDAPGAGSAADLRATLQEQLTGLRDDRFGSDSGPFAL